MADRWTDGWWARLLVLFAGLLTGWLDDLLADLPASFRIAGRLTRSLTGSPISKA